RAGQMLVGMLDPLRRPQQVRGWLERHVTAVSLDLLPRTLSRAQAMDALSSQATLAGYKSVLVGANAFGRYFPMLTTAAGTSPPRGAVVTAFDIRPQARAEAESVGARFLDLSLAGSGEGAEGYARALTGDEQHTLQQELARHVSRFDVVITTAQVPGRRPPLLVVAEALEEMDPGSVVVDVACGELGGNVEGAVPDTTIVTPHGVTVIGAGNLPSQMAPAASAAYARNLTAL